MEAPLRAPSSCVVDPPPNNWNSVPVEDHARLNAVLNHWQVTYGNINMVELAIEPTQYAWHVYLMPGTVVSAMQLEAMSALAHVVVAECRIDARSAKTSGMLCIYVRTAAHDIAMGSAARIDEAPAPLGGASYTGVLRAGSKRRLAELARAAHAATGRE